MLISRSKASVLENPETCALASSLLLISLPSWFAMALLLAKWTVTGRLSMHYLPWNLFLAWIPLGMATLIELKRIRGGGRAWQLWSLLVLWLLFLPNSPYIFTDLIHIVRRRGVVFWYEMMLVMSFSFAGLMAGIESMRLVWRTLSQRHGAILAHAVIIASALLSGVGIYVGRVLRWNSWDVMLRPHVLVRRMGHWAVNPWDNRHALALSLLFGLMFAFVYLVTMERKSPTK